jgi:hypothetical protein
MWAAKPRRSLARYEAANAPRAVCSEKWDAKNAAQKVTLP